eukprot:229247-Amphidinium_carterae.1
MFAWAATIRAVASEDAPISTLLESILKKCSAPDPESRPRNFAEIAEQLMTGSYVQWGLENQLLQARFESESLSKSNQTAVEAAKLLAEERKVWRQRSGGSACSSEEVSEAYIFLSDAYLRAAKPDDALEALEKSKDWDPEQAGRPEWLERLGNAYGSLGNATEQCDCLERALQMKERRYSPGHPEVAITLGNLGNAYGSLADASKQLKYLGRAFPILLAHFGPDHPEVAWMLNNVGNAYGSLGDASKQLAHLEKAFPIWLEHFGPDHPELARTLVNLGAAYGSVGDAFAERDCLEWALRIDESHYEHVSVAETLTKLAVAYASLRDAFKQRVCLERALRIKEEYYGQEHPEVALALAHLALASADLGDLSLAHEQVKRALRIFETSSLGAEHPDALAMQQTLAFIESMQDQ